MRALVPSAMSTLAATLVATAGVAAPLSAGYGQRTDATIRPRPLVHATQQHSTRDRQQGIGENLSVTVPPVLFGPDDGVPQRIEHGTAYDVRVLVWVAGDQEPAQAWIHKQPPVDAPDGATTTLTATLESPVTVQVRVRVGHRVYTHVYHHKFHS
jgi:hypothetical protein